MEQRRTPGAAELRARHEVVPDLSVVVPSVNGWSDLEGCLRALDSQSGGGGIEIVVVDRVGPDLRERVRSSFPEVRILEVEAGTSIPAMRSLAFRAVRADIVAVLEDHVLVPPDWARRMLEAQRGGAAAVGGAVDNAAIDRLVDRAAFLCEYSHCLSPPAGPASWLTGNNVTYRRDVLNRFLEKVPPESWEDRLHAALRAEGIILESRPDIRVGHKKHYRFREYVLQRFLYARAHAGARRAGVSAGGRVAFGLASLLLPPLLLGRIVARALRAGRHRLDLVIGLPLLVVFVTAWAAGEAVGCWRGPGDALARVC
jgi:glycosyltransferase involved in cell wall biosynthesis